MTELIDKVNLAEVIRFSSALAKRKKTIEMLYDAAIANIETNVDVWEKGFLAKAIDSNLWIFGEEYEGLRQNLVDSDLERAIESLIHNKLEYKAKAADHNLIDGLKPKVKRLGDIYLIRERFLSGNQREVIVVFIKSPSTLITSKEATALQSFLMDIHNEPVFPKQDYSYSIMYVGSQIEELARNLLYQEADDKQNFAVKNSSSSRVSLKAFAYEWQDLVEQNKRKMEFMNDSLKLNGFDTLSSFIQNYGEFYQPTFNGRFVQEKY